MTRASDRPKRLLCISTVSELYGGERCLLDVVQRLGSGWTPSFVVPKPGRFEQALRECGYDVRELIIRPGHGRGPLRELPAVARLARIIRSTRADLVHLNLHFAWPIVSAACLAARVPLVIHVRNMVEGRPGRVDRWLFQRAAAAICISRAVQQRLVERGLIGGHRPALVHQIPDGRVLAQFQGGNGARLRAELGIAAETPLIGMIARLEPLKGQDIFLKMALGLAGRLPAARFAIVGAPMGTRHSAYVHELEALARHEALQGRVSFLGFREDIPDVLSALDCLVHPSRTGAFVSVLIEAMAAGVPIVASDIDGIPECVGRDGVAELVDSLDPAAFGASVLRVVTDADRRNTMRRLGRERACGRFAVEPLARQTERVFAECLRL